MTELHPTLEKALEFERHEPHAQVIEVLAQAAHELSQILATASLTGKSGAAEGNSINSTGDTQKKLDILANDLFLDRVSSRNLVHRFVSEEMAHPQQLTVGSESPLLLAMDPLDGSSNLDVNGTVASIFGIYRDRRDPLPTGRDLLAAGYFLFGPSTILMLSTGHGVNGYTLHPATGKFLLSHPAVRCPNRGNYLCANVAHFSQWPDSVQAYMDALLARSRTELAPISLRYSGAMATDVHRILLEGGIYIYPPDSQHWTGKIRLLYESVPMAFLFDQAGGTSSNCMQSLLDVPILEPHQQDHTALGSVRNVQEYVDTVLRAQKTRESA
jgi:fructose-1,6-bisphosphatase I